MADQPTGRASRFNTPSARLDLGAVAAKQTRKIRVISLIVAIVLHGSLAIWKVSAERRAVKPLTTRFIKREPRLVKPLELRKAPKPKRRQMRRRMKRVRAKVDTRGISRAPKASKVLDSLVRPQMVVSQSANFERPALEPLIESSTIRVTRSTRRQLDMKLEMVDVEAFHYGRDRAMVVQDLTDRRRIKGYFDIATVTLGGGQPWGSAHLKDLAEAFNSLTDINVRVVEGISVADPRLMKIPWVLVWTWQFVLPFQAKAMGKYMTEGGFVMVEGSWKSENHCRNFFRKSLEAAGLRQGAHWEFEILPNEHPMYHSYFDFDGAPWGGNLFHNRASYYTQEIQFYKYPLEARDYIEGITLDGRLVAIYETKNYVGHWRRNKYLSTLGTLGTQRNNVDIQKLGINIIVFALTQEGSIATRTVASSD